MGIVYFYDKGSWDTMLLLKKCIKNTYTEKTKDMLLSSLRKFMLGAYND